MTMLKKTFFGLSVPRFHYKSLSDPTPRQFEIPSSRVITLHIKEKLSKRTVEGIQIGDKVKTGERLYLDNKSNVYSTSTTTGTVETVTPFVSNCGASYTAVSIKKSDKERVDPSFEKASITPNLETMARFLATSPGEPPLWRFSDTEKPIETIILYGGDTDLFLHNSLRIIIEKGDLINRGIDLLRTATGVKNIMIVVPEDTVQNYSGHLNATIKTVSSLYPCAQPLMIEHEMTGRLPGPKNKNINQTCFLKLEAVATIGRAFKNNRVPLEKNVTIIDKMGEKYLITVKIGTHLDHILRTLKIKVNDRDKIIFGGPMTGSAIYAENYPILPDTDLIFIQDENTISSYSAYPCINCGECVRVCPSNVPVNLLVRFLEVGRYEEGADLYDLYSCIECGLCSYVCVSRIPVFQHIKLAKYELDRTGYAEEMNE